jgi:predicted esterase
MTDGWETLSVPFTADTPVRCRPGPRPEAPLVVLCHGMGETPDMARERWPRLLDLPVHVVAPRAPHGFEVREDGAIRIGGAWYLYDGGTEWFRETVIRSADWLRATLDAVEAERGWRPRERALVGHSQGAYFGYVAALRNQDRFRRLVAAAGRLKTGFLTEALAVPGTLHTLILHGERDRHVRPEAAERTLEALTRAGYAAELRWTPGGHRVSPDMDGAAAQWLSQAWSLTGPS